jgi:hypothetical protein
VYDELAISRFVSKVRQIIGGPLVVAVIHEFAVYFDELGVTVKLDPRTKSDEVLEMKQRLFDALSSSKFPFEWLIVFEQDGKKRRTLFPDGFFTGIESET